MKRKWFVLLLLGVLTLGGVPAGAQSYLHHSLQSTLLVADPEAAAEVLERWAQERGGYVLLKSSDRIVFRYPSGDNLALSRRVEELSEDILELSRQAVDLREQVLRLQAGIRSREEILQRNMALLDRADVAGTLAIEKEVFALVEEMEEMKGALGKLEVDRAYGRAEVAFQVLEQSLPDSLPSSFPWINTVDLYAFLREGAAAEGGAARLSVDTPEGFARLDMRRGRGAVSPEGMLFRVRTAANEPRKGLEFWSQALENHLRKAGYRPAGPARPFQAAGVSGVVYEWAVPYGHESYLFLTALAVEGRRITLAEAAAPYSVFVLHRSAVFRSLETMKAGR